MTEEKQSQKRGQLTDRIKQKSVELFGYEISQKELRLLAYVLYEAANNRRVINLNEEEQLILDTWGEKQFLMVTGIGSLLSISEDFWNKGNQLVFLGYVDLTE